MLPFFIGIIAPLICPLFTQCSPVSAVPQNQNIRLTETTYQSFDGDQFPYTKWLSKEEPEQIIIGVHGISGAALDYKPLASHLLLNLPKTAVYAAETRGQGNDPTKAMRGHIHHQEDWFRDLYTFTALVRQKHPEAKIIWCGESMGSLIVMHAYASAPEKARCDAMILSSPITDIRGDFPQWKEQAAHFAAMLFPKMRISLETLSGQDSVNVTKDSVHQEQITHNPYHIKRHTLRLLSTLGKMVRSAQSAAQKIDLPILILYGGKDIFSDPKDVEAFAEAIPEQKNVTRNYYPKSYHLLFYDHQSQKVVEDTSQWLQKLP